MGSWWCSKAGYWETAMTPDAPDKRQFNRQLITRQLLIAASLILLIGTFVWLTMTGSQELNLETGQTHELTLRAVTRYLTSAQVWTLRLEGALVVLALINNGVFMIRNRQSLRQR
jgi:NADH:ubiquinone oxidoreductase subunit 6 (subunit J)